MGKKWIHCRDLDGLWGVREEFHKVTVQELQFSPRFLFAHRFVLFFDFFARVYYLVAEPFVDTCGGSGSELRFVWIRARGPGTPVLVVKRQELPLFVDKVEELADSLKDVIRDNDVIVTMGAGNITTVAHGLPARFAELLPTGPGSLT